MYVCMYVCMYINLKKKKEIKEKHAKHDTLELKNSSGVAVETVLTPLRRTIKVAL